MSVYPTIFLAGCDRFFWSKIVALDQSQPSKTQDEESLQIEPRSLGFLRPMDATSYFVVRCRNFCFSLFGRGSEAAWGCFRLVRTLLLLGFSCSEQVKRRSKFY